MNITRTITPNPHGLTLTLHVPPQRILVEGQFLTVEEIFVRMYKDGFTIDETFAWIERRSKKL
jgi:hypothetical protein